MKVISRRENESLVIGEDISVTVLEVHADRVRLAISSPRSNPSYREETLFCTPQAESEEVVELVVNSGS